MRHFSCQSLLLGRLEIGPRRTQSAVVDFLSASDEQQVAFLAAEANCRHPFVRRIQQHAAQPARWIEDLDERGPTDLAQLTQLYGWAIGDMQARFLRVAHLCFVALAAMYAAGIMQATQQKAALASEPIQPPVEE